MSIISAAYNERNKKHKNKGAQDQELSCTVPKPVK
jgi:hypothetical protein